MKTLKRFLSYSLPVFVITLFLTYITTANALVNDRQITVNTPADIAAKRQALISFTWGTAGFPSSKLPSSIDRNVKSPVQNLSNLERVDTLHISMDAGVKVLSHHFVPKKKNNRVVFINPGHTCTFDDGIGSRNTPDDGMQRTINRLLAQGFSVLAVYMPRYNPVLNSADCGKETHDSMFKISTTGNPMKFFLEPVAVSLNYLKANFPAYQDFNMVGLSGGGWTTNVYTAIDPRIKLSFSVAGSLPLYLRWDGSTGDKEQYLDSFYQIAGYPDLYVMGSYGSGRKQIQILNRYDNCCFGEAQHNPTEAGKSFDVAVRNYETKVKTVLKNLGSDSFRLYIDEIAPFHTISDNAILNVILPVLNGKEVVTESPKLRVKNSIGATALANRLYVFAGEFDSNRNYYTYTVDGHRFGPWVWIPSGGTTDVALATASLGNSIYVFTKGIDDKRIYHTSADNISSFGSWVEMPGDGTTDVALATASLGNSIYVFSKGIDDKRIYHTSAADGQAFGPWVEMPGNGTTDAALATASFKDRIYVFAKGIEDKRVYVNSARDGQPFGTWALLR